MVKVNHYVYSCGGFNCEDSILQTCERFNLLSESWDPCLPLMNRPVYSATVIKVGHTFIYSFGGNIGPPSPDQNGLEIERLDTEKNICW